ncbi:hypothetical protein OIN60_07710 [Paenibacillus sp. P96]|uniref:DUF4825 domain-containing protein n=1 Tax=Paenibacillus zeirhizosphaerae TaxID=2987519 RepID=A0ABT9FPQ6_9BACL|nr:hypothetical protein [Paenibacillus sp. P96]MDP4096654.1 hypothetical protein [Paenibacillus sp. P96]
MKRLTVFTGTLLLTIGAAALLPVLQQLDDYAGQAENSRAVLLPQPRMELNDYNLVDQLNELSLTMPITKVNWKQAVLTLDLKMPDTAAEPATVYKNIADAASYCFYGTSNVQQLLLRVVAEDPWTGKRHLLIAADIRRDEWSADALRELRGWSGPSLPEELKNQFRISDTKLWRTRFHVQSAAEPPADAL